jgi:hypothetical protein
MSIVTKEQYDAAVAAFAEAKKAAAEIRIAGWTVYEVIQHETLPFPHFYPRFQVTESLEAAMSKPLNREAQYLIMKELYAADGTRYYEDGKIITQFKVRCDGRVLEGWLRDTIVNELNYFTYPACHDQWLRVRLEDYGEQASVLGGMKKPAEWLTPRFLPRGVIRIVFPAGAEEGGCDGDCCCGDSDTGSESDDYDSDEE